MLIEVKTKTSWIIDSKIKKITETYILDREFFSNAEYAVTELLNSCINDGVVDSFEILSIKQSSIKEVSSNREGREDEHSYIATLKDSFLTDEGAEKSIKYKMLFWSNNISDAMSYIREYARQGYDMQIESLKEVDYVFIEEDNNESTEDN